MLILIHLRSSATMLELVCCLLPEASAATSARQLVTQDVYHSFAPPPPTMEHFPLVGKSLLPVEASRPHSIGLLLTSDQPDAETST